MTEGATEIDGHLPAGADGGIIANGEPTGASGRQRNREPLASFETLVTHQRAHREFSQEPVPDEVVASILRAATYAPSTGNKQPWVFVVVREAQRRAALGTLMKEIWESFGREYTRQHIDQEIFREVDRGLAGGGIAAAPVIVVVGGNAGLVDRASLKASVYPAVQNLLLAAGAAGLGSCLTTIGTLRAADIRSLVGFPADIDPLALVPLGYPGRALGRARREPIETRAHRETYGAGW